LATPAIHYFHELEVLFPKPLYASDAITYGFMMRKSIFIKKVYMMNEQNKNNLNDAAELETSAKVNGFHLYDLLFLVGAILIGWEILNIPLLLHLKHDETFILKNITASVLPAASLYLALKRKVSWLNVLSLGVLFFISIVFINFLPNRYDANNLFDPSETVALCCIFLPVLWWISMGIFLREKGGNNVQHLMRFISQTGESVIAMIMISFAWGVVILIGIYLFNLIGIDIWGKGEQLGIPIVVSVPLIAVWLTEAYPQSARSSKFIFGLIIISALMYLVILCLPADNGADSMNTFRGFLMTLHVILLGAAAVILFALCNVEKMPRWLMVCNGLLCSASVILAGGLIYFLINRTFTGGITPNRFAALGVDAILGVQLTAIAYRLFSLDARKSTFDALKKAMTIPFYFYGAWAAFVIFAFPLLFHFK